MKKKNAKKVYKPTLQTHKLVPITDPAVQAAFDEMSKMEHPVVPEILRQHARMIVQKYKDDLASRVHKAKRAKKEA